MLKRKKSVNFVDPILAFLLRFPLENHPKLNSKYLRCGNYLFWTGIRHKIYRCRRNNFLFQRYIVAKWRKCGPGGHEKEKAHFIKIKRTIFLSYKHRNWLYGRKTLRTTIVWRGWWHGTVERLYEWMPSVCCPIYLDTLTIKYV